MTFTNKTRRAFFKTAAIMGITLTGLLNHASAFAQSAGRPSELTGFGA